MGVLASGESYDPREKAWSAMPPLRHARSRACGNMVQGNLVIVGGCGRDGGSLDSVEIFDVRANAWRFGSVLPETLECATSSEVDEKLYVTGGFDPAGLSDDLHVYDVARDVWTVSRSLTVGESESWLLHSLLSQALSFY